MKELTKKKKPIDQAHLSKTPLKEMRQKRPVHNQEQKEAEVPFIYRLLEEGKASDITVIDVKGRSSFTDTLIIASGTSTRHIAALAKHLAMALKKRQLKVSVEGTGAWVVLDVGSVVVHLFHPETRRLYALEEIWQLRPGSIA